MLTGFQVSTGAYIEEYGELLCADCFDHGDTFARPLSNYALDEEQSFRAEDGYCAVAEDRWDNDSECGCEPALLCDQCGGVIRDEFEDTYVHDKEEDDDESDPAFD